MPHLVLIKHAMPIIDPQVSPHEWQLAPEAEQSCQKLAELLVPYTPAHLVSSPEPKAIATAQVIAAHCATETQIVSGLEEHHRATEPYRDSIDAFHQDIKGFFAHPMSLWYGEETAEQAFARYDAAMSHLVQQHADANLIVVSHGTVISLFASRYNTLDPFDLWLRLGLPSMLVLELPDYRLCTVIERVE